MYNKDVARILKSEEMKVFWTDVQRYRDAHMKDMLEKEDVSYAKAVKVLDKILALPSTYENN